MDAQQTKKILDDTMEIIQDFFIRKCENSELIIEIPDHRGFYYMDVKTAKKLKQQFIKYKTRLNT